MRAPLRLIARKEALWCLGMFLLLQLSFLVAIDVARPDLYDAEGGIRLRLLKDRIREAPEKPVLLVVGSSRLGLGFTPQTLPSLTCADGREVIAFNYAHLGAGPRMNLLQVRRALRAGIRPQWIVLEIVPGGLAHEGTQATMATAVDLPTLLRHTENSRVWRDYLRNRLNPFYKHRQTLLRKVSPPLYTQGSWNDKVTLMPLGDDLTWMRIEDHGEKNRRELTEKARQIYSDRLKEMPIDHRLDGATRELLGLCREHGIKVTLLLTPEDSLFRSWYAEKGEQRLKEYLGRLQSEFGVEWADARTWVEDSHFCDPHHLKVSGARIFTERLAREVLQPLVQR